MKEKILKVLAIMALLCSVMVSCSKSDPESPVNPGSGTQDPGTGTQTTDPLSQRWTDTGADLPAYPSYNKVSSLSDFPRINITTDDGKGIFSRTTYKTGKITFLDPKKMYSEVTSLGTLTMRAKCRGNTTTYAEGGIKIPYRLKLDQHNKVFGMKGDKDWILLPDLLDPSLLRTAVSLRIARMVSMPWTTKFRTAELYLNGDYMGCYLIVEAKEADRENKVPVTPVEGTAIDGGYFLELDMRIDEDEDNDKYFITNLFGKTIHFKDPENPTNDQKTFIRNYVNAVEQRLFSKQFDPSTGYRSVMEVSTFINYFIVEELTMNIDGNMRLSTYFAKDADTKLFIPMVWDFDRAIGNCDYLTSEFALSSNGPTGWFIKIRGGYPHEDHGKKDTYFQYLFMDPLFVSELKARWNQVKPRLDLIPGYIDKMSEYNSLAYDHNSQAGKNPHANRNYSSPPNYFQSWQEARDWMKDWYSARLAWLDGAINNL